MIRWGLNTEHHARRDRYVSFIYNQGGQLLKWYRDTCAAVERETAAREGRDIYDLLIAETPPGPSTVTVLPAFTMTGPPEFLPGGRGGMFGLSLETTRGDILKGIMESTVFYHKELLDALPRTGIAMDDLRAVGGGSRSDTWLQLCADIWDKPVIRARVGEAGCLGAAIVAGLGLGRFSSLEQGVEAMVGFGERFEPRRDSVRRYNEKFQEYRGLWHALKTGMPAAPRGDYS